MKKEYTQPEIELVKFAIEDIIATSDPYEGPLVEGSGGEGDGDLVEELNDFSGEPLPENIEPDTQAEAEPDTQMETEPETESLPEEIPEEPLV